jgi:hypothetical protein
VRFTYIDTEFIHAHWPELIMTAHTDTVFCACGAQFADGEGLDPAPEQWAAHLATEVNGRARMLAERAVLDARNMAWEDEHAGPRKPKSDN